MKLLILGAAGQISRLLTQRLLNEATDDLVLYARQAESRIKSVDSARVTIFSGDFNNQALLEKAMTRVDVVYLNDMNSPKATETIIAAMKKQNVPWIIGATILGIYDEVAGAFGKWNLRMVGEESTRRHREASEIIENSGLNYSLLRLTWLYNEPGNLSYTLSQKGEPFIGAEVSREAVTQLVMDILNDLESYKHTSLGVSEPNTDFPKPSFY